MQACFCIQIIVPKVKIYFLLLVVVMWTSIILIFNNSKIIIVKVDNKHDKFIEYFS